MIRLKDLLKEVTNDTFFNDKVALSFPTVVSKDIKLIELLKENINWSKANEFYDTGNYVTIQQFFGTVEFGLETLSNGEEALFINDITINPEFQGKGYGSKIIQSAIKYAEDQGIPIALRASVGGHYNTKSKISQEDLIKFYQKFGFELKPDLSNFEHDNIFMVKS